MAWIVEVLVFVLFAVTEVTSKTLTECFYEIGTIRGVTYLGSMFCQYGCCGTSQEQRCCTRDEKYPNEDEGRAWRIVALAFAGVIIVLALSLVACWVLKRKNKKNVRVRTTNYSATGTVSQQRQNRYAAHPDIFTINFHETQPSGLPPAYSYLPKYSETVFETNGGQNQNPGYRPDFETNGGQNQNPGYRPDFETNGGQNQNPGYRPDFETNGGQNQNPCYRPDFETNGGQNQNPGYRPDFETNGGQNQNPGYRPDFETNSGRNQNPGYRPDFETNGGQNQNPDGAFTGDYSATEDNATQRGQPPTLNGSLRPTSPPPSYAP